MSRFRSAVASSDRANALGRISVGAGIAATLAMAILIASIRTASAVEPAIHVFKPGRGISLDVGATKVAGYYVAVGADCGVTLMMGARADADGNVANGVVRMELPVKAGAVSRVTTPDGRVIALSCGTGARLLTVSSRELVALAN
ncbi:MAG: hypothetical protein SH859_12515 [Hyphomicrobium aestuarii]|nr:hypothetical protein [Hyphomicrobium aestuarii]